MRFTARVVGSKTQGHIGTATQTPFESCAETPDKQEPSRVVSRLGLALVLLAIAACVSQPAGGSSQTSSIVTVFEGARLITGDGSASVEDSAFIVEGTRFTRIGVRGAVRPPDGAAVVDLRGMTVIPALVDAHSHLGYTDVAQRSTSADLEGLSETLPPDQIEQMRQTSQTDPPRPRLFEVQARNLVRLAAAGVRIGFGTDAGVGAPYGWSAHAELADMVAAGLAPHQVLVAATSTSAGILGLDGIGRVAESNSADFIVLQANPLEDISNTRQIARVYLRGQEVDRGGLRAGWTRPSTPSTP